MVRGPDLGYLPEPAKSIFIFDKPEEKELEREEFEQVGLNINCVVDSISRGALLGDHGEARGLGAAQGRGMCPRGLHPR